MRTPISKEEQLLLNPNLIENGYMIIPKFFTTPFCSYLNMKTFQKLENPQVNGYAPGKGHGSGEHHRTWNTYGHDIWETIMHMSHFGLSHHISDPGGEKKLPPIIPTYSYHRMYMEGAAMAHHSDRPSCQISLTINIGQTHSWPIYVTSLKTKKYVEVIQEPGDALVYLGCNVGHYRPKYKGDWYSQLFIHYVLDNDMNAPHFFDNQNRRNMGQVHQDPMLWEDVIEKHWKMALHQQGIMDKKIPYNEDEYNKEVWFPLDQPKHPFLKPGNMDVEQEISKEEYEMEVNKKSKIVNMKADPDDLPKITDIHGNEYDPKKMSDEQHDFAENDLPDGIEIG